MRPSKIKYPLIYIEWCDAFTNEGKAWFSVDEIMDWAKNKDWIICQSGYLIEETKEYLLVVSQMNPQRDGNMVGGVIKIPKTWIRKRKLIKL